MTTGTAWTEAELNSLWHVGASEKRTDAWNARAKRKQIGKFGIGKLATYVLARRVTYITQAKGEPLRGVSIDFEDFRTGDGDNGAMEPITLQMLRVDHLDQLLGAEIIEALLRDLDIDAAKFRASDGSWPSWTLVVLEDIRKRPQEIRAGRLRWVLSTAMPAASDFKLYLNGDEVESSKLDRTYR